MRLRRLLISIIALGVLAGCGSDSDQPSDRKPASGQPTDPPPTPAAVAMDPQRVERGLLRQLADRGFKVTEVTCPDEVGGSIGNETTCDVDYADGRFGNATMKVIDEKGRFELVGISRSLLDTDY